MKIMKINRSLEGKKLHSRGNMKDTFKRQFVLFSLFIFQLLSLLIYSLILMWNDGQNTLEVKGMCSDKGTVKNVNTNSGAYLCFSSRGKGFDMTSAYDVNVGINSTCLSTCTFTKSTQKHSAKNELSKWNFRVSEHSKHKSNTNNGLKVKALNNLSKTTHTDKLTSVGLNKKSNTGNKELRNHFLVCQDPLGRLGNWMFQFASSLGIARQLNYTHVIKPSHKLLPFFDLQKEVMNETVVNLMKIGEKEWKNRSWRNNETYLRHNLTILGHLQSWKYFENASTEVRKAFTVKPHIQHKAKEFLRKRTPKTKTLIGVHVRRGDFTTKYSVKQGRVVADKFYIKNAMEYFRKKYDDAFFIVVSDDKAWCKENIEGKDVIFSNFKEPILDMSLMTLSDHAIITAGSFSWWGGWLSKGTVVYLKDFPRIGSSLDGPLFLREEYYLPEWIGMSNGP